MHPVLLKLGPLTLHTYGLLVAVGGILSCLFWLKSREKMGVKKEEDLWLLVNAILVGGFLGGRLLYLFEYARPLSREFWATAFSLGSGFSVLGAFAGVTLAIHWFCRRRGAGFLRVLDYVCAAAPFWHFFGRLGCFAAGCCFGHPAGEGLPWAVSFNDPRAMLPPERLGVPLHPAQLYEAFGDIAIAVGLYGLALPRVESGRWQKGSVAAAYFASYAALRFSTEFFRGDVVPLPFLGLTAGQGLSLALLALGAGVWRAACIRT